MLVRGAAAALKRSFFFFFFLVFFFFFCFSFLVVNMRLYSQSFSLRAQLVLHAWRRCSLLAVGVAAALLLAGLSAPAATDALQLRVSPQISSFSASPSAASPVSAAAAAPTPSFVGYSGNESATAAALPVTLRAATHAAITDSHLASTTSTGSGSSRRRTAASTGTLVSPASSAATAAAAVQGRPSAVEGSSAIAAPPANGAPAAATGAPAAIAAPASRAATRLAYVNSAPSPSSRACRRLYSSGSRKEKRNSWSSSCQQQPIEDAVAAVSGSKYGRRRSWLHTPPLHQQRLAAAPAGASGGAVVEGEKVNGKSVRDWKVERTLYQALHMALAEEMHRDPSVCVMGEDVGHYGGSYKVTKDLHAVFGNLRVMDTPICENTFTGMAIGAAMNGLRPVVEGMNMGFLLLAFNQISNNAGMVRYTSGGSFDVPVVIRGPGGVGKQLGPEHSQRIEAYLMAVPGLKMVACSTPYNARGLLKSAIREDNPVVFFEHVLTYNMKEEIPLLPYTLPLDRAEVVREGNDVTVLAYGKLRYVALEAAKQLDSLGVSTEVVDLISLKPLDMVSVCKSLRKTGRCVILDESSKTGGIGGEILSQVVENCADELLRPPVRLATKDIPTPYARELEDATIVTPADVVNAALWMMSSRSQPTIGRHLA